MNAVADAEGGQVAHDVSGAARQRDLAVDRQDRHRRFLADAGHLAIGVAVEHHVADHQHVGMGQTPNRRGEVRLWLIRARCGALGDLVHSTCRNRAVALVQPIFACGGGQTQAAITRFVMTMSFFPGPPMGMGNRERRGADRRFGTAAV